jgi:hypothetical protein
MEKKRHWLTKLDQKHPITFLLIRRKNHDAREVVVVIGYFFLLKSRDRYGTRTNEVNQLPLKRNQGHDLVGSRRP